MDSDEDALRAFKNAVFNAGVSPGRGYVQFFADAMRWPVDAFASRTVSDDNRFEHHVAWLKGNAIGSTSYVANGEPTLTASVHSLAQVARIELGATNVRDDGFTQTVTRSMSVHFSDAAPLVVDLSTFSSWTQREQASLFIDAVVDVLAQG
jgi:hypothetical protein